VRCGLSNPAAGVDNVLASEWDDCSSEIAGAAAQFVALAFEFSMVVVPAKARV
jgi:hypothetical protein